MRQTSDPRPPLFDRSLARRRLARAKRAGPADFLLARAADDLADRVGAVLRDFPLAVDLGTPAPHVVERLARNPRIGTLLRAAPTWERPTAAAAMKVVADPERLPFADAQFDLAVSVLALHQVDDLLGSLIQIRRLLRPDGLFVGCLTGGSSLFELREALAVAEDEIDGGASPRVAPFARVRDMVGLMQRAAFAMPVVDVDSFLVRYPDLLALMHDLRAMGATNVLVERRRTPLKRSVFLRAAEVYASRHADPDGRLRATFEFVWLSGWSAGPDPPIPSKKRAIDQAAS